MSDQNPRDDHNVDKNPSPRDAQKGGQGAVGKEDPGIQLNQEGDPSGESRRSNKGNA